MVYLIVMKKERINIYIHPDRYKVIQEIAAKEERSISSMIDIIMKQYIDTYNTGRSEYTPGPQPILKQYIDTYIDKKKLKKS